jgi:drug/metabolite transporter (DMT)-like permease
MTVTQTSDAASGAKLLVLLLAFAWGFNWIGAAFALQEVPPWSLRFVGTGIGAITLVLATWLSGRSLKVPPGAFKHILIAGFFNVSVFNICSAFAQLYGATSRAVIITYSMPIWASVLAWLILGDRLDRVRLIASWSGRCSQPGCLSVSSSRWDALSPGRSRPFT